MSTSFIKVVPNTIVISSKFNSLIDEAIESSFDSLDGEEINNADGSQESFDNASGRLSRLTNKAKSLAKKHGSKALFAIAPAAAIGVLAYKSKYGQAAKNKLFQDKNKFSRYIINGFDSFDDDYFNEFNEHDEFDNFGKFFKKVGAGIKKAGNAVKKGTVKLVKVAGKGATFVAKTGVQMGKSYIGLPNGNEQGTPQTQNDGSGLDTVKQFAASMLQNGQGNQQVQTAGGNQEQGTTQTIQTPNAGTEGKTTAPESKKKLYIIIGCSVGALLLIGLILFFALRD